jgi:DNA (cytosine-5)-methyltransferase 1
LENVKNLKTHDKGNTFKTILSSLEGIGYCVQYGVLNTCEVTNVPQNRERVYMVCFKDLKLCEQFSFDFEKVENDSITDFLEDSVDKKYYYTEKLKVFDEVQKAVVKHIATGVVYQYRRYYVRENKSGVCPTLTANMGEGGHNVPLILDDVGIRKLTPRECFNLQGFGDLSFPKKLSDSKLYKLAGNAVSVPVVRLIVERLMEIL